jgi:hypothetical protein
MSGRRASGYGSERRAQDSNLQGLAPAGFQDRCLTIRPALPTHANLAAPRRRGQCVDGASGGGVKPISGVFLKIESAFSNARVANWGFLGRNGSAMVAYWIP